jgi:CheY-like chemotaxis protein
MILLVSRMKLLLISSNYETANSFREALRDKPNCEHLILQNASFALAILADPHKEFSHVIVDLGMPGSTGLIICDAVGRSPKHRYTELWTISCPGKNELLRSARQLGAVGNFARDDIQANLIQKLSKNNSPALSQDPALPRNPVSQCTEIGPRKFALADKIPLTDLQGFLSRDEFDAYFASLSKPELVATRIVAIKISNAKQIFPKITPDTFYHLLRFLAQVLTEYFEQDNTKLVYNGGGVFLCAFSNRFYFDPGGLVEAIHEARMREENWVQFILTKLDFHVGQVARAKGVFKSEDSAKKQQNPGHSKVHLSTSVALVDPRRPRVRTRVVRSSAEPL